MDEAFNGKKVLITGGLGFIGSTLAHRLVNVGAHVLLVDSLIPEYGGNLFNISGIEDRLTVNISDVRDPHSMTYLVQAQDYLFNLAGQTSHMDSMKDPFTDLEINCRAQLSILETCRQFNPQIRVVFASTRQVYGRPEYLPVDEKHPIHPVDTNGINKLAGEWYHILYSEVYGIRSSVLRLTNTYGPRMRIKDARQTFLGTWIYSAIRGEPFQVWGGEQLRDFTYVDDAVSALMAAALHPETTHHIYNLGGERTISLKDLASLLASISGGTYTVHSFPEDRKRIDIGDYYADFTSIRETLNWEPQVYLTEGLEKTVDYYRKYLQHYVP